MTEDQLATAQADLLTLEGEIAQLLTRTRYTLEIASEEVRQARKEAAKSQLEFFTEEEFAERLKLSAVTVGRMRRKGRMPYVKIEGSIRYTTDHLVMAAELFDSRRPREAKKRKSA